MYEIVSGPLVWLGFVAFIAGTAWQLTSRLRLARKDKVVFAYWSGRFGMRSVLHWVLPLGSRNMRARPFFTLLSFSFHASLLLLPLFAMGHAVLWEQSWGIRWPRLPGELADGMTVVVIVAAAVFLLRRVAAPQVRNVTTARDYVVLLLVVAPFATGFAAHHQWFSYSTTLTLHVVTGVCWLAAIPFTRLSHMIWFFFTRTYMGSEFGAVRHARDW